MKNLKKLIAIVVATTLVMSTTVLAKTTATHGNTNYQKADITYGQNLQNLLTSTGLPQIATDSIINLYNIYGMNTTQEQAVLKAVGAVQDYLAKAKATAATTTTTVPSDKEIIKTAGFIAFAQKQLNAVAFTYGLTPSVIFDSKNSPIGITFTDQTGQRADLTLMKSDYATVTKDQFKNVSTDKDTVLAELQKALDAAVAASINGTTTEMPVATPTETPATGTPATVTAPTGTPATVTAPTTTPATVTTPTTTPGTATTPTTTPGTATTPTKTAVDQLGDTLTGYGVKPSDVAVIKAVLNSLPKDAADAVASTLNAFLKSGSTADYEAAKAAIEANVTDPDLKQQLLTALDEAKAIVDGSTTPGTETVPGTATTPATGTNSTNGGGANGSGANGGAVATTPSTLPKTATNNANMAVAGLAMITVAGTVFFISKKRMA